MGKKSSYNLQPDVSNASHQNYSFDGSRSRIIGIVTRLRSGKPEVGIPAGSRFMRSSECPDQLFELPILFNRYRNLRLKRPGHEADHPSPFSAEVEN
jgi:hypothetical protein